jgi:hypothetical protein
VGAYAVEKNAVTQGCFRERGADGKAGKAFLLKL